MIPGERTPPGLRVPSGRALTARVLLVFLAGLLIATGLVGGAAMLAARQGVLAEAHLRAEAQARRIAERISVAAARRTPTAQLLKGADVMLDQVTTGRAALVDPRGRVLRESRPAVAGEGSLVQARVPIRRLGWTVVVERSRREVTAPLFDTLRRAAAGTALLVTAFAILGALVVHRLTRPLRDVAEALAAANARLVDLNRAKSDFVSLVAHELRTPLTSIKGFASLLLQPEGHEAAAREEFLRIISSEALRLNRLIENLLNLARIEAGQMARKREPVNLARAAQTAITNLSVSLEQHRILLDLPEELPSALADPDGVIQIFMNLLANAMKYAPAGTVTISARAETGLVTVHVTDEGPGIPPEDLARLFDRFFRRDDERTRAQPGTGLGLSVCRALVEAHGGKIWAENPAGGGARFVFTLPRAPHTG